MVNPVDALSPPVSAGSVSMDMVGQLYYVILYYKGLEHPWILIPAGGGASWTPSPADTEEGLCFLLRLTQVHTLLCFPATSVEKRRE